MPLILLICSAARADHPDVDPLFADQSLISVSITAPFSTITKERPDETEIPGTFTFTDDNGQSVELYVGLRTRGRYRRREDTCAFPPLRLNFRKSETKDTLFDKQDKLKLVTHCQNNSPRYEQTVISEYLAYRIFSNITDFSFHARLVRITYVDTDRNNREMQSYAILIEHRDRLAKRLDMPTASVPLIALTDLQPDYAALAFLFQYLLGNTDFSPVATVPGIDCCHNHELFKRDNQPYYSIPYDFDMTGFVNAPHARPDPRLRLHSVQKRMYRGHCMFNPYLESQLQVFRDKRESVYELIESHELLTNAIRKSQLRYIDKFYDIIDNPRKFEKNVLGDCK